jgi:ParB/RepB/Spo0J family partition protein
MVKASKRSPKAANLSREIQPAKTVQLPVDKLVPSPHNARDDAGEHLENLTPSVRDWGLLQPLVARPLGDVYEIVAGERRWRSAKAAGLRTVPVTVRELSDADALIVGMTENIARRDLGTLQRARGIERLVAPVDDGGAGLTHKQAARLFGKSDAWTGNHVRLLRLPESWQKRLAAGEVTERMARSLVPHVEQPDVLAAVERDRDANPLFYRTSTDFELSVKRIAAQEIRVPESPAAKPAIKPPRAAPSALSRLSPAPSPQPPAPVARDYRLSNEQAAERDSDDAFLPVRDRTELDAAIAADYNADVCCDLIAKLVEIEQLEQVEAAIVKRRAELMKLARGK